MTERISEDDIIARYFAPIAGPGALGLRDDAACVTPPPGCDLVLTKDAIVAGVHFLPDDPPASVARKALRVNISDLAAKGADGLGFLLAAALPPHIDATWLAAFCEALAVDARTYECPLLGGDTVRTPGPLTLSVTALGSVPHGRMAARTGARPGDRIYVSGTIGDAAIGLYVHQKPTPAPAWLARIALGTQMFLEERYLHPKPRYGLRHAVRDCANGAMDVSDGLVGDLAKMMRASDVGARVQLAQTPLSQAAREAIALDDALFEVAVTGGDDYEILCAVPLARAEAFEAQAHAAGVSVCCIGDVCEADDGVLFTGRDGAAISFAQGSFSHF